MIGLAASTRTSDGGGKALGVVGGGGVKEFVAGGRGHLRSGREGETGAAVSGEGRGSRGW